MHNKFVKMRPEALIFNPHLCKEGFDFVFGDGLVELSDVDFPLLGGCLLDRHLFVFDGVLCAEGGVKGVDLLEDDEGETSRPTGRGVHL